MHYFYIKHENSNKTYKFTSSIIQTFELFGGILLKNYIGFNPAEGLKKYEPRDDINVGTEDNPLVIKEERKGDIIYVSSDIFDMVMDWVNHWEINYNECIYGLNPSQVIHIYSLKEKDRTWFEGFFGKICMYMNCDPVLFEQNIEYKWDNIMKFCNIWLITLEKYLKMRLLYNRTIFYVSHKFRQLSVSAIDSVIPE
jgi:hypothetical protein